MRKIIVLSFLSLDGVMKAPVDLMKIRQVTSTMVVGLHPIFTKPTKRLVS